MVKHGSSMFTVRVWPQLFYCLASWWSFCVEPLVNFGTSKARETALPFMDAVAACLEVGVRKCLYVVCLFASTFLVPHPADTESIRKRHRRPLVLAQSSWEFDSIKRWKGQMYNEEMTLSERVDLEEPQDVWWFSWHCGLIWCQVFDLQRERERILRSPTAMDLKLNRTRTKTKWNIKNHLDGFDMSNDMTDPMRSSRSSWTRWMGWCQRPGGNRHRRHRDQRHWDQRPWGPAPWQWPWRRWWDTHSPFRQRRCRQCHGEERDVTWMVSCDIFHFH